MKPHLFIIGVAASLLPVMASLHASDKLRLETAIYIFRTGDFHEIKLPEASAAAGSHGVVYNAATAAVENHGVVLQSPATVGFDQVTLSLEGSRVTWSGASSPPAQFTLVAAPPTVPITAGKPVTMTSSAPVEYLERLADNSLQVRKIAADAPEAPHFQLTFEANPVAEATGDLLLGCDLDIATVCARENIPGVALEVGKPVIARFKENLKLTARPEQWAAALLKAPNGSDYSLLLLFRVTSAQPPKMALVKVADYRLKTARYGATAVAEGNYVYVIGGLNRGGILGDIERFDVRTHEVTQLTDQLIPRHHQGAVLVDGKIYIFGGRGYGLPGSSGIDETLEIYDLASGKISHGAPMPWPHVQFAAAALGGKIYAIGGAIGERTADVRQTNRTDVYDIAGDSWSLGSPMPTPRETRTAVVVGDAIIVAGGYRLPNVSTGSTVVECFLPAQQKWVTLPDLAHPVGANSAAVLGNRLYFFGNFDPSDEILSYDLTTHQSATIKDQLAPASQSTAVALDGTIYVIGGNVGAGRARGDRDAIDAIQVFALAPGTVAGAGRAGRLMTAAELDYFATSYYRHPRPELVAAAIEAFGPSGFVKDRGRVYIGFFAEVFAANPGQRVEWRRLIDRQDESTRGSLRYALNLSRPGAILASTRHSVELNDMYWGAFFASGNPAYLRKLVEQLRFIDERRNEYPFEVGATAMWSLARNAPEHPLVRATLEAVRTEVDPRTRDIIDDLLDKDPSAIRNEIYEIRPHHGMSGGDIMSRQNNPPGPP